MIKDTKLRKELLDRQIDGLGEAIRFSTATWIFGLIISSVAGVSLYNYHFSWNKSQLKYTKQLYYYFSSEEKLERLLFKHNYPASPLRLKFPDATGILGQIDKNKTFFIEKNTKDSKHLHIDNHGRVYYKDQLERNLKRLETRAHRYDSIQLPFIESEIASSDIGTIGSFLLGVTGFWLWAINRREYRAFDEFIRYSSKSAKYGFSTDEIKYAYRSIANSTAFLISGKHILKLIILFSFCIPPLTMGIEFFTSYKDLEEIPDMNTLSIRMICEFLALLFLLISWLSAFKYKAKTMSLLSKWFYLVERLEAEDKKKERHAG